MKASYDIRICPTCGGELVCGEVKDSSVPALVCPQGHRFYLSSLPSPGVYEGPPEDMEEADVEEVLHDARYRRHFGSQLPTILRRIREITRGLHVPREPFDKVFHLCPRCGSEMDRCKPWDDWCAGLCCKNGHRYDYRNGLHFIEGDESTGFSLEEEMPDETVLFLCRRYVEDQDESSHRPPAALEAMREFVQASGG